jgi:hypothetical protein
VRRRLITYGMEDSRVTIDELFAAGPTFTLIAWGVRLHVSGMSDGESEKL